MGLIRKIFGSLNNAPGASQGTRESHADESAQSNSSQPGLVRGRHFTEWTEHVKQLKREKKQQEVIDLCLEIMTAAEEENRVERWGVPPWWYEQVALAARRSDQPDVERAAIERYLAQPGNQHPEYVEK